MDIGYFIMFVFGLMVGMGAAAIILKPEYLSVPRKHKTIKAPYIPPYEPPALEYERVIH